MIRPLSRRREIEAAIAAHNSADRETLLPPSAARLLTLMFPQDNVCQRRLLELEAEGFDGRTLRRLLRALVDAGFAVHGTTVGGVPNIYRLHLPPVRPWEAAARRCSAPAAPNHWTATRRPASRPLRGLGAAAADAPSAASRAAGARCTDITRLPSTAWKPRCVVCSGYLLGLRRPTTPRA